MGELLSTKGSTKAVLRLSPFRRLIFVVATTSFSEFLLESVVYVWIVVATVGDPEWRSLLIGMYVLLSTLPRILGAALLGVAADRIGGRASLLIANIGRAIFSGLLLIWTGIQPDNDVFTAALLLIGVTILSTLNQLFLAARAQLVQRIVESELRPAAASVSMTVLTALSILSAAIGPAIFERFGLFFCLSIVCILFIVGSIASWLIRVPQQFQAEGATTPQRKSFFASLIEGWKACWQIPHLRIVLIGAIFYGVPMGINNVALILLWVDTKGASISQYGIASALFGAGALLGSLAAGTVLRILPKLTAYAVSLLLLGAAYVALAWIPILAASFLLMAVSGFLFSLFSVIQSPLLLDSAPPSVTGRVVSTTNSAAALSSLIAALMSSLIFALVGSAPWVYSIAVSAGGLLTVIGGALLVSRSRRRT